MRHAQARQRYPSDCLQKAQRRAVLKATGGLHILRHTFCSHLAMKGAPALSIQKLAGHDDLQTTLGYMHLAVGRRTEPDRREARDLTHARAKWHVKAQP